MMKNFNVNGNILCEFLIKLIFYKLNGNVRVFKRLESEV